MLALQGVCCSECVAVCCNVFQFAAVWCVAVNSHPNFAIQKSPPKNGKIAFRPSTNGSISEILVLAGSESIFTRITGYKFISLLQASPELQYGTCLKYCTNGPYDRTRLAFVKHTFAFYYTCLWP